MHMLLPENMQPEVSIYYNGAMVLKDNKYAHQIRLLYLSSSKRKV